MRIHHSAASKTAVVFASVVFCALTCSAQSLRTPRITQPVDDNNRVTLKGNTHPLAKPRYDQGPAPDDLPMNRMLLVLQRSPAQEAALQTLLDQQQAKSSASFHQWLTPAQFGQQYGVADSDIQTVSAWLQSHGFQIAGVSNSNMVVEFSGTAGEIRDAFHTEIHKYVVNGESHWANNTDPQIPAALAPVIAGVDSMHNFPRKPQSHKLGLFQKAKDTGKVTPMFSFSGCDTETGAAEPCNALGPADYARLYNILPLWNAGITGQGQTIALVGDSDICTGSTLPAGCTSDDILAFRTAFGLPTTSTAHCTPSTTIVLDGPDPGLNGDETEGDLDSEWSGAVAPCATILFVTAENTEASAGIDLAAQHIIDNNLAPVMSESFGECEGALGNAGNLFYKNMWEQAAAQGITVNISAGDSGSAGCDDNDYEEVAEYGTFVNGIGSTVFDTAVGGTDFDYTLTNYQSTYWTAPPTSQNSDANCTGLGLPATFNVPNCGVSILGYVPETTWNDSCANSGAIGCNSIETTETSINIVAGGGGQSNCEVQNESNGECDNGYLKPAYQSGSGVPQDGVRDVPDIALFASDGANSGSFFIVCEADQDPTAGNCNLSSPFTTFIGVGGTSSAAPAFAGIMAMVNQEMASTGHPCSTLNTSTVGCQGNANYTLYPMASTLENYGSCSATSVASGNSCVFYDVTLGDNSVPCYPGTQNCSVTNPNSLTLGILVTSSGQPAYAAGSKFDLVTGLGSINAYNFVTNWPNIVGDFTPTTTSLGVSCGSNTSCTTTCPNGTPPTTACSITLTHGDSMQATIAVSGVSPSSGDETTQPEDVGLIATCPSGNPGCFQNGSNTGSANLFIYPATATSPTNPGYIPLTGSSTTATTNFMVGGTYDLTAHYAGDGVHGASTSPASPAIQVTVNPEQSTTKLTVINYNVDTGGTTDLGSGASVPYGSFLLLRADVIGIISGSNAESATGTVDFSNSGNPLSAAGSSALNSEGYTEVQSPSYSVPGVNNPVLTIPALVPGAYSLTAAYQGGPSYQASTSSPTFPMTVTKADTCSYIVSGPSVITSGVAFSLTAFVDTSLTSGTCPVVNENDLGSLGNAPSGTVSFYNGSTLLGTANLTATFDEFGFSASQATLSSGTIGSLFPTANKPNGPRQIAPHTMVILMLILMTLLGTTLVLRKRRAYAFAALIFVAAGFGLVSCGGAGSSNSAPPGSTTANISVVYNGDTNYTTSTSQTYQVIVEPN
jgi:Pro-kumamolisin, activation domain